MPPICRGTRARLRSLQGRCRAAALPRRTFLHTWRRVDSTSTTETYHAPSRKAAMSFCIALACGWEEGKGAGSEEGGERGGRGDGGTEGRRDASGRGGTKV